LHRRLPKKGFSNAAFARKVAAVNVGDLNDAFNAGDTVTTEALLEKGLVDGRFEVVKVLGNGKLEKALVIDVDEVSAGARVKIEQAGGSIAGITAT
jgi:large subunit ribosomal protein L15